MNSPNQFNWLGSSEEVNELIPSINIFLSTNHIFTGAVYILSGIIGGSFGIGLPIIIRVEIALPGFIPRPSLQYNSCITFHGILTILFMIMPLLIGGFGNPSIPLMLCPSDTIFPRLNALSLRLLIDPLFLLFLGMFLDGGVNAGWTPHVPPPILNYSSVDPMFFPSHFAGLSPLLGSINSIVSLIKGCNLSILFSSFFLPLFPRSIPFTPLLLILSLPVSAGCTTMLIHDRHSNSSLSDPLRGGDLLLLQHPSRSPGHPEAYTPISPALGLISEILSKFIQCFIFGRDSTLIALFIIGMIGRIAWGHHTSIVGFDIDTRSYSTPATPITAIPTGIKILNRFATVWSGCFFSITPLSPIIGSLFSFSSGGSTGPIPANRMIDTPSHDSYSVAGHFHYVLSPGAVHTFYAAFHNYLLSFSSYFSFNDFLGRIHSPPSSISSNPIFFSMHSPGIFGSPRRTFDYPVIFFRYHRINSFGTVGVVLSILRFIVSILYAPLSLMLFPKDLIEKQLNNKKERSS